MNVNGIIVESAVVGDIGTNCYIVHRENNSNCVVIDPGDQGLGIGKYLEENNLTLDAILLTHAHFDHILGVPALTAYSGGELILLDEEMEVLENSAYNLLQMSNSKEIELVPDELLSDGHIFTTGGMSFEVMHTPGHTKGSCCYYMKDEKILFSGDTLFFESVGRTDFPTGSYDAIVDSVNKLVNTLPEDVQVFPGHGPVTKIGYEKRNNPYVTGVY